MHAIVDLVLTWIYIFHIKDVYMKSTRENNSLIYKNSSKVYIHFILNPMLLPEWSTAVFLFSDSCSWVPCLSWTVKLSAVLQKNPSGPSHCWKEFKYTKMLENQTICGTWRIFLKNSRQFKCSGQTRDSWTTITKQKNTAVDHSGNNTVLRIKRM